MHSLAQVSNATAHKLSHDKLYMIRLNHKAGEQSQHVGSTGFVTVTTNSESYALYCFTRSKLKRSAQQRKKMSRCDAMPPINQQHSLAAISIRLQSYCAGAILSLHNKPWALVRPLRCLRYFLERYSQVVASLAFRICSKCLAPASYQLLQKSPYASWLQFISQETLLQLTVFICDRACSQSMQLGRNSGF